MNDFRQGLALYQKSCLQFKKRKPLGAPPKILRMCLRTCVWIFLLFFFLRLTDSEKILLSYHFFVGIAFYERKIINSTELEPLRQNLFRQKTWNQLVKNFEFESKDYFKALS